jgi:hypothetical protein
MKRPLLTDYQLTGLVLVVLLIGLGLVLGRLVGR